MAELKCKMCGGTVEYIDGASVGTCDSCGSTQTLPKFCNDALKNMFERANSLRQRCEFDKAEEVYNKLLEQVTNDPEIYWGIVLCRYGIEYVTDPATGAKIPTCHRASYDTVVTDFDYRKAMECADATQRVIYAEEARKIDALQHDIIDIVKNETPYDVFICYKETDENGQRTQDSVLTNDIYYQLTQEGFKVFYAAITLEDKLGTAYEPYIFAALNSAKVMLVVGSKPEYFNAVWVKNEWSRYMKLMKEDRSKLLIPCYKDMDPYNLPIEFAHLQAQDMSKIGFVNDVVRGIKKVIVKEEPKEEKPANAAPQRTVTSAPVNNYVPQPQPQYQQPYPQQYQQNMPAQQPEGAEKNKWVALILCFFLGALGGHKFYEGKIGMGIVYLFTGGLFLIGAIIDFFAILGKPNPYYVKKK